ncbi:MAG TPA: DinB family protein [Caldilineaceae bacterium]|nr:DinB family protein [Caldilineaceae bacterium]
MSSPRALELADRLQQVNEELMVFVQQCQPAAWRARCPEDGRSVGVVAHHIAASQLALAELLTLLVNGEPVPTITGTMLDENNAAHATRFHDCTAGEVMELMRAGSQNVADLIRQLDDEQLTRRATGEFVGAQLSAEELIQHVLIGHAASHFRSIRAAMSA